MNLCDIREIKALLNRHGFHFSKSMGQNFLIADWVPQEIAQASGAGPDSGVLEIGPGIGPLTCQLARRAGNGLARTGSLFGHGSGDVAIAFSSSQHLPQLAESAVPLLHAPDGWMDRLFQAAAEATEQAIFKALFFAEPFVGRDGHRRPSIQEVLPEWRDIVRS